MAHASVLLQEVIEGLDLRPGLTVLDGTVGAGGHAEAIASAVGEITIIGLDVDSDAIGLSSARLAKTAATFLPVEEDFRNLDAALDALGIAFVDRILFDLGVRSDHFDISGRGFSVTKDEPLLMTLGHEARLGFTARDVVNGWEEDNIAMIISAYGEDRFAKRIARAIVRARSEGPIERSSSLAEIVSSALPPAARRGKIHPATRTFQAIRIAVNDEIGSLREGLSKGWERLSPEGRFAVISFHSIEDRVVKDFFRDLSKDSRAAILTKKPLVPSRSEILENPRSRSAKLRIARKLN